MDPTRPTPRFLDKRLMEIQFPDGTNLHYPADYLRAQCPCATCTTGPDGAPCSAPHPSTFAGVEFKGLMQVGTYAFRIIFSDNHSVGIYSFDILRAIGIAPGPAEEV